MYNFDEKLDRRGTSQKWDAPPYDVENAELLPMWIADTDFATPSCVLDAIKTRLAHPIMGYFEPPARFYECIAHWNAQRRGIAGILPQQILYQNSTVGAIVSAVNLFTKPGEGVLVHTPNYTGFQYALSDNNRLLIASPLKRDAQGVFRMDFADMEKKIREHAISCMILCSPHNPTGRVWTTQELRQATALCEQYGIKIISDEVWADFVFTPNKHVPTPLISDYARRNTISLYGATKTFNLAGLRIAYSICFDETLAAQYKKICTATHYNAPNVLSVAALIGAYSGGEQYVDELLHYIRDNMRFADHFIKENVPALTSYLPQGTYTLWLKFNQTDRSDEENMKRMSRLGLVGDPAHKYNASGYFRLNLACPKSQVEAALVRLQAAFND
ncbi:MAG: MalY/PatB family protein [Candidatus Fimivivens sp.]